MDLGAGQYEPRAVIVLLQWSIRSEFASTKNTKGLNRSAQAASGTCRSHPKQDVACSCGLAACLPIGRDEGKSHVPSSFQDSISTVEHSARQIFGINLQSPSPGPMFVVCLVNLGQC